MKLCMCGGLFVRKGENQTERGGIRYQCRECGSLITVRDGQVVRGGKVQTVPWVTLGNPLRPQVRDWRHVSSSGPTRPPGSTAETGDKT